MADGGVVTESGPPTFADFGIPKPPELTDTPLGKVRQFRDVVGKERAYVIVSILMLLATMCFTIYKIATVSSRDPDFTFALVLLVSIMFCLVYVCHGILQERASEVLVYCTSITVFLIYLIINYSAGRKDTIKLVRLIVAAVMCPPVIAVGLYLSLDYFRSGNLIFRTIGASTELQNMCRLLFFFFDLLKFDMQLSVSMVIFIITSRLNLETKDIVILSVGGVATIVWFFIGYYCMKRESKIVSIFFFLFSPVEAGYVIYKLWQTSEYIDVFSGLAGSTIACGVMALVVRFTVIIAAIFVVRNFNKGLKEKAFGLESNSQAQGGNFHQPDFVP